MAVELSIRSTSALSNKAEGVVGNVTIYADRSFADPSPSTLDITLQVRGYVPGVDFLLSNSNVGTVDNFTWTEVSDGVWDGIQTIPYTSLNPSNPMVIYVIPLALSQIGNVVGVIELVATAIYDVSIAEYEIIYVIEGNPDVVVMSPGKVLFNNAIKFNNQNWALVTLYNNSGDDYELTEFRFPSDALGLATYFYDDSGTWTAFSNGNTELTIASATSQRMLIKLTPTAALDISDWYLKTTVEDQTTDPDTVLESVWGVDGFTEVDTLDDCAHSCIDVDIQSLTWIDGTVIAEVVDVDAAVDLGNVIDSEITNAYADVVLRINNNCTHSCDNGDTSGSVRIGDLMSGWYPFIESTEDATVSLTTTVPVSDSGFEIAPAGYLDLTYRITADTGLGVHGVVIKIATLLCTGAAANTPTPFNNANVIVEAALPEEYVSATSGTDFCLISLTEVLQGNTVSSIQSKTTDYTSGKWVGSESRTGYVFVAPATKTYYFKVCRSCADAVGSSEREISYYKNGAFSAIITENQYAHTGYTEFSLALTSGDEVAFGAYIDNTYGITNSFSVTVSDQNPSTMPILCNSATIDLGWTVISESVTAYPISATKSAVIGTSEAVSITLTNAGTASETIEDITISAGLVAELTTYFPEDVVIAPEASYTFNFVYTPVSEYATKSGTITFVKAKGSSVVVPIVLTAVAQSVPCYIAPENVSYNFEVESGVAYSSSEIIFFSSTNSGKLKIVSPNSILKFPKDSELLNYYEVEVVPMKSYPIPISIVTTTAPAPFNLTWTLYEGGTGSVLCTDDIAVNIVVAPSLSTACPLYFQTLNHVESSLHPDSTGTITINFKTQTGFRTVGDTVITFKLPVGDPNLEWNATQLVDTDLTWTEVDAETLQVEVSEDYDKLAIPVVLDYAIASDQVTEDISSSLTATAVFTNANYDCDDNNLYCIITLEVESDITSGGFGADVAASDNVLCSTINVLDGSNYGTGNNHARSDFTLLRQIEITLPSGNIYTLSSVGEPDESIGAPANTATDIFTVDITTGGLYKIVLYSIPTYNELSVLAYAVDDHVVVGDVDDYVIYKLIDGDGIGIVPGSTPGWENSWEIVDSLEDVGTPYVSDASYVQMCDITAQRLQLQEQIFCSSSAPCQNYDTCFKYYSQLRMFERLITEANYNQFYDRLAQIYVLATEVVRKSGNC
jgi:hypothetical protein